MPTKVNEEVPGSIVESNEFDSVSESPQNKTKHAASENAAKEADDLLKLVTIASPILSQSSNTTLNITNNPQLNPTNKNNDKNQNITESSQIKNDIKESDNAHESIDHHSTSDSATDTDSSCSSTSESEGEDLKPSLLCGFCNNHIKVSDPSLQFGKEKYLKKCNKCGSEKVIEFKCLEKLIPRNKWIGKGGSLSIEQ